MILVRKRRRGALMRPLARHQGSFSPARPGRPLRWDREAIVEAAVLWAAFARRWPCASDWTADGRARAPVAVPSRGTVTARFGSWEGLRVELEARFVIVPGIRRPVQRASAGCSCATACARCAPVWLGGDATNLLRLSRRWKREDVAADDRDGTAFAAWLLAERHGMLIIHSQTDESFEEIRIGIPADPAGVLELFAARSGRGDLAVYVSG